MKTLSLDYLMLGKTKIDDSFPASHFNIEVYKIRGRCDRDKYGGRVIKFSRRGLICKKLRDCEPKYSEYLCSELAFTTKNGYVLVSTDRLSQAIFQRFLKN